MSPQHTTIASWSGPRNISTAMMRSWGNRNDTVVCDEPLYAHYLLEHGLDHPGREEIVEHGETDVRKVIEWLTGPHPGGKAVFYQKHMAHHLVESVPREWILDLTNVFLIRDPRAMLLSLDRVVPAPSPADTGLPQQLELFRRLREKHGQAPPVIDARDVLRQPRGMLHALCAAVDVEFQEEMLHWPAGPRETDGIWARHWYGTVLESTGFAPFEPRDVKLPRHLERVLDQIEPAFRELYETRLEAA